MLVGVKIPHAVDRRERDAPALRLMIEVLRFPPANPFFHHWVERIGVAAACEPILKNLLVSPFGVAHHFDQAPPLILLDASREDEAVGGVHDFPGREAALTQPRSLSA